ncbi:MAG: hypothetical protein IPK17_19500 [Chloroflexi bacterium]|uniref:hypothetical protein n=1 Tax=Candidatus Flexifilum breve TaxID=3140694 RepID=UPI00313669EB|nr:hypothetical protein [Chloroflexota bacterium]
MQFSQYKALLKLSDEALELADRHQIEEYRLRPIVSVAPEYHSEIVRQIIDFNLTAKQVRELCDGDGLETDTEEPLDKLPPAAMKMARAVQASNSTTPQDIARALMRQEGDAAIARARLQALRKLLTEAERYLTED